MRTVKGEMCKERMNGPKGENGNQSEGEDLSDSNGRGQGGHTWCKGANILKNTMEISVNFHLNVIIFISLNIGNLQ